MPSWREEQLAAWGRKADEAGREYRFEQSREVAEDPQSSGSPRNPAEHGLEGSWTVVPEQPDLARVKDRLFPGQADALDLSVCSRYRTILLALRPSAVIEAIPLVLGGSGWAEAHRPIWPTHYWESSRSTRCEGTTAENSGSETPSSIPLKSGNRRSPSRRRPMLGSNAARGWLKRSIARLRLSRL